MSGEPVTRAHPEPVVLNIGGGLGALIVHWDASQIDTPIEISPAGHDSDRQHQHILERPIDDQTFYAAVFDTLPEGAYALWVHGELRERDIAVTDGAVTELHWPAPAT